MLEICFIGLFLLKILQKRLILNINCTGDQSRKRGYQQLIEEELQEK